MQALALILRPVAPKGRSSPALGNAQGLGATVPLDPSAGSAGREILPFSRRHIVCDTRPHALRNSPKSYGAIVRLLCEEIINPMYLRIATEFGRELIRLVMPPPLSASPAIKPIGSAAYRNRLRYKGMLLDPRQPETLVISCRGSGSKIKNDKMGDDGRGASSEQVSR